ncbi:TRAP transporter substrate-binding protein [Humitalea sp. 24SJ18S-53]|uniref:TRAP transporter substrate-binding protein n=1 Tax=Humitalea sp. 24SJ18S-53 TaxID=3422307 RepID=UPI003D668668
MDLTLRRTAPPQQTRGKPWLGLAPVFLLPLLMALGGMAAPAGAQSEMGIQMAQAAAPSNTNPTRLRVLGGLADVGQYTRFEEPFWRRRVAELTGGRVEAEILPFDRAGFRGPEMLQLMRLGVVPFGTALLSIVATDEPEFNAADLPAMNPDIATMRQTLQLFRPRLAELLRENYNVELLSVYTYPAQVVWCDRAFGDLADLAGRRIRASSVGMAEVLTALGAVPVVTPFSEIVSAMRTGVVECAVTGTLSGMSIGLHEVTTHVSQIALSWGVSVFGANIDAWEALPEQDRGVIRAGLADLESAIWDAAGRDTIEGLACAAGQAGCQGTQRGRLTLVPATARDEVRRRTLLTDTVLPAWVSRCGRDCVEAWNRYMAPTLGLTARE